MASLVKSTKHLTGKNVNPSQTLPKNWKFRNISHEPTLIWYQSQKKTQQKNFRPIFLMNECKILHKIANWIQQHIKKVTHHDQVWFILGMQRWFNIWKTINVITLAEQRINISDHLNRCRDTLTNFNILSW